MKRRVIARLRYSGWPSVCLLFFVSVTQTAAAQNAPLKFDSQAVENATVISQGTCSNPVIGISFQLPPGMKPEDAAAMHMVARSGAMATEGIGPEARYFLYGYEEAKTTAILCGAANQDGQVQVVAVPAAALKSTAPAALQQVATSLAKALESQPVLVGLQTINGHDFERVDARTEVNSPTTGKVEIQASFYVAQVNSYIVMWNLVGYSQQEWKRLIAGMNSVTTSPPQSAPASVPQTSKPAVRVEAPDFQARLAEFLEVWLTDRDRAKTMTFFDPRAYTAPPLIGAYCDGWYKKGSPAGQAAKFIADNLAGVPSDFPKGTPPAAIFKAWNRIPPRWVAEATNDVSTDRFLVAQIDRDSLHRMFSGVFAGSDYGKFLQSEIGKGAGLYLAVFPELAPDGDVFVIFTLWQKSQQTNGIWKIVHVDVVCQ